MQTSSVFIKTKLKTTDEVLSPSVIYLIGTKIHIKYTLKGNYILCNDALMRARVKPHAPPHMSTPNGIMDSSGTLVHDTYISAT